MDVLIHGRGAGGGGGGTGGDEAYPPTHPPKTKKNSIAFGKGPGRGERDNHS